jgi:hypothetical protein
MVYEWLKDSAPSDYSYDTVTIVSCVLASCALVFAIGTYFYDVNRNNGIMSMNVEERSK